MSQGHETTATDTPRSHYEQRREACLAEAGRMEKSHAVVMRMRGGVLGVWLLLLVLALNSILSPAVAVILGLLAFAALLYFAASDERMADEIRLSKAKAEIAGIQLARLDRDWQLIPEQAADVPVDYTHTSHDLDVFGHASLYQLICRAHSPAGRKLLRDWFSESAPPSSVRQRNLAAEQLALMREFREQLDLCGRLLNDSGAGPAAFVAWAEGERWLEARPWLRWSSRLLVMAWLGALLLGAAGVLSSTIVLVFCLVVLGINLLLSVLLVGNVHDIFNQVDSRRNDVVRYRELLDLFESLPDESELLTNLKKRMSGGVATPRSALTRLSRIMGIAQMRHSGLFGVFHLLLQLALLIDFHVLDLLEHWHRHHGPQVRGWFDAVGELEALSSLASLVHDQPDWTFPDYGTSIDRITAASIGHPLIVAPVCNDVEVGPAGTFLLVTGSNMSGKSTLLRSIGTNAILAQAGAPVCAKNFSLMPVEIASSMRIQDSLEDGVSFFMAELKRLKEIVDRAKVLREREDLTMLFLLDEILQGTNSAERHIAVTRVVKRLTEEGGLGAISTHDLELASSDELTARSTNVHFRESISDADGMTFDYAMRQGVATTTNALKLLELVGIR